MHPSIEEEVHAKPVKKKNPCKAKDVTVPDNHYSKVDHGDIGFLPPIPNSGGNEVLAKPVRKRAPRIKKLEILHDSQCLETPLPQSIYPLPPNNEDGCQVHVTPMDLNVHPSIEEEVHAKHVKTKIPCKANDVTVPDNHCSKLDHGDIGFLPPIPNSGGNEVLAKPVRKRAPTKKKLQIPHDSQCLGTPLQESCGFTGTPRNMNLPDLNKPPSARMSPKHTSIL